MPGFDTAVFPYTTDIPFLSDWGQPLALRSRIDSRRAHRRRVHRRSMNCTPRWTATCASPARCWRASRRSWVAWDPRQRVRGTPRGLGPRSLPASDRASPDRLQSAARRRRCIAPDAVARPRPQRDAHRAGRWCPPLPFFVLLVVHARVLNARDRARRALRYYERGFSRLDGTWMGTGADGERFLEGHPYARDLDLFGRRLALSAAQRRRARRPERRRWPPGSAAPPATCRRDRAQQRGRRAARATSISARRSPSSPPKRTFAHRHAHAVGADRAGGLHCDARLVVRGVRGHDASF